MVTLIAIAAGWIIAAIGIGFGVGRVIARADVDGEMAELTREHQAVARS